MADPTLPQWDGAYLATFLVEIDNQIELGRFSEISGLQIDVQVEEYTEGGENGFVHKLPGRMTWPNLVLKRGVTKEDVFMNWLQDYVGDGMAARSGKSKRTTLAVTLLGPDGVTRLRKWNVVDAMPVRWTGPSFASDATGAALEELEIAHHGFKAN
jgi:phage tail-like protein